MRVLVGVLWLIAGNFGADIEIKVNPGKYFNYFHIEFELIPDQYRVNSQYGFTEQGQFEVFVAKERFPIPAPNCKENIIIRMPASISTSLEKKRNLYNALMNSEQRRVVLELNPYVNVISESPLELELQNCNVFFRQTNDNYHDQF